jgi:hypothetical protein
MAWRKPSRYAQASSGIGNAVCYSALILAALMIGHHFSISAF